MARVHFLPWLMMSLLLLPICSTAQSVGIGTTNPNPNAVLHVAAPNGNQGLLVPRIRSAQRLAFSLVSPADDGMVVYDLDDASFYYWAANTWHMGLGSTGGTTTIDNFIIDNINRTISLSLAGDGMADQVISLDDLPVTGVVTGTIANTTIADAAIAKEMIEPGLNGQVLVTTGGQVQWEDQSILSIGGSIPDGVTIRGLGTLLNPLSIRPSGSPNQILVTDGAGTAVNWINRFADYTEFYAVDPVDFIGLKDDDRVDKEGAIVFNNDDTFVSPGLKDNQLAMTAIHVPHMANLKEFRFFYMDNDAANLSVVVLRKELASQAETSIGSFTSSGNLATIQAAVISIGEQADNSRFSYRVLIKFDATNDVKIPDDARQRFYGGTVEYVITR